MSDKENSITKLRTNRKRDLALGYRLIARHIPDPGVVE
jgi:hypothetical protein